MPGRKSRSRKMVVGALNDCAFATGHSDLVAHRKEGGRLLVGWDSEWLARGDMVPQRDEVTRELFLSY